MESYITLVIAVLTVVGNIIISKVSQSKTIAIIETRLAAMEKKQDIHNSVIERVYKLEQKVEDLKK